MIIFGLCQTNRSELLRIEATAYQRLQQRHTYGYSSFSPVSNHGAVEKVLHTSIFLENKLNMTLGDSTKHDIWLVTPPVQN